MMGRFGDSVVRGDVLRCSMTGGGTGATGDLLNTRVSGGDRGGGQATVG